ncbi:MAG: hypothetical protein ACJA0G_002472 [Kangiellaceae bacterium]
MAKAAKKFGIVMSKKLTAKNVGITEMLATSTYVSIGGLLF